MDMRRPEHNRGLNVSPRFFIALITCKMHIDRTCDLVLIIVFQTAILNAALEPVIGALLTLQRLDDTRSLNMARFHWTLLCQLLNVFGVIVFAHADTTWLLT